MILVERYLLSFIFQNNSPFTISDLVFSIILPEDFTLISLKKLAKKFFEFKENNKEFSLKKFINFLPEELRPVFDEVYLFASMDIDLGKENIRKIAYEIKKNSLKQQIKKIISLEDQKENKEKLRFLCKQLKEVEKKLISL
jgi:hypothetical protein